MADVGGGYEVVMADLLATAALFGQESATLSGAVSAAGVTTPDGGDATVNAALATALKTAGLTTGQLAAVVESHGEKLKAAHQAYDQAELSSAQLCERLTSLIAGEQG
jgi:hypothetical protein